MATIAELLVRLGAEPQRFIRGIEAAGESFDNFLFHLDQGSRGLRSVGLASQAAGAAILAFAGVAVAASAQAQREQVLLGQAIEATGRAAEFSATRLNEQAQALQRITPFSDEAVNSVQRLLIGFRLTQEQVESLTPRVLDIAARLGVDVTTAANAVGRAFTFGVTSLRRLGIAIDDNLDPLQDFDGFLRAIDRSSGGAARAAGQTFAGALARLRNAVDDVLEAIGAPLLGPLASIASAMARVAEVARGLLEAFPGATRAVVFFSVALGALLLGAGGIAVFLSLVPRIPGLLASWSGATGVLIGAVTKADIQLKSFLATTVLASRQMGAMAAVTATVAGAFARLPALLLVAAKALRVLRVAVVGVAGGVAGVVLMELGFRLLGAAIERAGRILRPFLEGLGLLRPAQSEAQEAVESLNEALRRQGETLEQVEANYKEAKAATDLFVSATKRAAAESARLKLLRPGVDEAGVKAVLERLQEDQRNAEVAAAEQSIATERTRLEKLQRIQAGFARQRALGLLVDAEKERQVAEQIIDARRNIGEAEARIAQGRLEGVQAVAEATARAEKEAAAARIDAERQVRDAALTLARQRLEAERERIREAETLRIDALRRVAGLERSLSDAVLRAREALFRAAAEREDAVLRARALERARLVREGFLEEAEAERQASADRFAAQRAGIERELALRRQRIAEAQRQAEVELGVAVAQSRAEQAIRQADLDASIRIGRAETAARVAELRAQLEARKAELLAEVEARRAAGLLSEAEAAARAQQIRAIEAGTQAQVAALLQGQAERERVLTEAGLAQRLAAEQAVAAEVQRVQGQLAAARAQGAADLVETEEQLRALISERREELRAQGVTEVEIDRQLRPAVVLLDQVSRSTRAAVSQAEEDLGRAEAALRRVGDALAAALEPFVKAAEALGRLLAPGAAPAFAFAPAAPAPPPGPPAVAAAAAAPALLPAVVFQVGGDVVARLQGDEAQIALRAIALLMGPEGNRLIEDYLKRTPGPRRPAP